MKLLFTGAPECSIDSLKRLLLVAEEIAFMDRPSVTFGFGPDPDGTITLHGGGAGFSSGRQWGTIGRESALRRFHLPTEPVRVSVLEVPPGPANGLYQPYVLADLANPEFRHTFLNGFRKSDLFASKFVQAQAHYGEGTGAEVREAILNDPELLSAVLDQDLFDAAGLFEIGTREGRLRTLATMLTEASIAVTSAMLTSEESANTPTTDDAHMAQLLSLRLTDPRYVSSTPPHAGLLGLAIAQAVVPDEVLKQIGIEDVLAYREASKAAYRGWLTEVEQLAAELDETEPGAITQDLARVLAAKVQPRVKEYRDEMAATADKLFGNIIKSVLKWNVPTLSLAYLVSLSTSGAIAAFIGAAASTTAPHLVDYFRERRSIKRKYAVAYLIGLVEGRR